MIRLPPALGHKAVFPCPQVCPHPVERAGPRSGCPHFAPHSWVEHRTGWGWPLLGRTCVQLSAAHPGCAFQPSRELPEEFQRQDLTSPKLSQNSLGRGPDICMFLISGRKAWVQIPTQTLPSCMASGKSLGLWESGLPLCTIGMSPPGCKK